MDINLLALSVGNSRLAAGVFVAGELQRVVRAPLSDKAKCVEAVTQCWELIGRADEHAIAGSSVNPPFESVVEQIVQDTADQAIQWVGRQIDLPIEVRTREPAKTGVDRVLNVAAAYEQIGGACVVVDAGTAITVDCCNDQGAFIGGAIAPGLTMMLDALAEKTAGVGRVTFALPAGTVGDTTQSAVSRGVYLAIRGLVKEFAEVYAMQLGHWPEIVATGGDAKVLFEGWELIHAVAPDLGLYGIAMAYANHHIEHGA
jgi:type III pantothenate kinase